MSRNLANQSLAFSLLTALFSCTGSAPSATSSPLLEAHVSPPHTLKMPQGTLVYEDSGEVGGQHPTIVCIPGIGDTRAQFRFLAPLLRAEGYRVLVLDPRGQGASQSDWDSYSVDATGDDVIHLLATLPGPVFIAANSAGGAAAAWVAAQAPERVRGLVLLGAFLRDPPMGVVKHASVMTFLRVAMSGPWGVPFWGAYYRSLYIDHPPADLDAYIDALKGNLSEPNRMAALRAMVTTSKERVTAVLGKVHTPVLVMQGDRDPDFEDPAAEADWNVGQVGGSKMMFQGTGHYPHVEQPQVVARAIKDFIDVQSH